MLGDVLAATLPQLQAEAESMMQTTAIVERITGLTTDPLTGAVVEQAEIVYGPTIEPHRGRCRVKAGGTKPADADVAGGTVQTSTDELHFPASATGMARGLRATIVASVNQPRLIGNQYRITSPHDAEFQTAQRCPIERWT